MTMRKRGKRKIEYPYFVQMTWDDVSKRDDAYDWVVENVGPCNFTVSKNQSIYNVGCTFGVRFKESSDAIMFKLACA